MSALKLRSISNSSALFNLLGNERIGMTRLLKFYPLQPRGSTLPFRLASEHVCSYDPPYTESDWITHLLASGRL